MALTAKKITLMTALTLSFGASTLVFAQPEQHTTSAVTSQAIERSEIIETNAPIVKTTRAASWQGKKLAIKGRDVVSFHKDTGPVKGSKAIVVDWDNTKWRFASEENRDLFLKDPERYVPEFGGFCPVALADNNAKVGKSSHYTVRDEKLYLNYNRKTKSAFNESPDNFLLRAQLNF